MTKALPSESQIEYLILEYLSMIKNSFVTKIAPSGFFDGKKMIKHRSKFIRNGLSDIFLWKDGEFTAIEVKTPLEMKFLVKHRPEIIKTDRKLLSKKKQHLKDQIEFIENIKSCGHKGFFVCSVDQVKNLINNKKIKPEGFCETYEMF